MKIQRPNVPTLGAGIKGLRSRFNLPDLLELPKQLEVTKREEKPVRKVGVLLVHGIGNQRRGKTLTQFGEPLFLCLENWLRNHSGGAELERVALRDEPAQPRTPAHAIVRLWYRGEPKEPLATTPTPEEGSPTPAPPDPEKPVETCWLLAESNWAEVFERPSFGSVAFWSIRVVPWFILTQFVDQLSDDLRNKRFGRGLLGFSYLVLTFPLALLIQLLVLILLPMSLLPPLRPVVAPIQRWISAVIGDTYVLLTSRFQFQSMVSTVREDLDWLANQCEVVAVLAHSQGAAVAHEALRQAKDPKVERLITFGSAVSRLKALRQVMDNARYMLTASTLVTLSALVLTGLYLWSLLSTGASLLQLVFGLWGLATLLAFSVFVMPFTLKQINEVCHERQDFALSDQTQWEDYYATADPVPNGQMLSEKHLYTRESREVHNGANIFTDHSTYWRNRDEFGSAVLHSLMTITQGPFETNSASAHDLDEASKARARRTRYRVAARAAAVLAVSIAVFQHPVLRNGVSVPEALQVPLGWLAGFVNWVVSLVADALGLVGSKLNLTTSDVTLPQIQLPLEVLSWPVACVSLVLLWYGLSTRILSWWDSIETESRFSLSRSPGVKRPRRAWLVAVSLLAISWIGFWVWWFVLSPADLVAQLSAKLEPLGKLTGDGTVVWILGGYYVIDAFKKAYESQREFTRQIKKSDTDLGALMQGRDSSRLGPYPVPDYKVTLPGLPNYGDFANLSEEIKPQSFLSLLRDEFDDLSERLGKRQISPRFAATVAFITALVSLAIVVFDFNIRGVVQAALGLISLSFGVLGWVRGRDRGTRSAAAAGLVIGVLVMPTASAIGAGLGTVTGVGLLVAGMASAACALGAAESLRRGWAGIL